MGREATTVERAQLPNWTLLDLSYGMEALMVKEKATKTVSRSLGWKFFTAERREEKIIIKQMGGEKKSWYFLTHKALIWSQAEMKINKKLPSTAKEQPTGNQVKSM